MLAIAALDGIGKYVFDFRTPWTCPKMLPELDSKATIK
jgi:hypothetical protein